MFEKISRPLKCQSNFGGGGGGGGRGGGGLYSVWEDQRKNRLCIWHMDLLAREGIYITCGFELFNGTVVVVTNAVWEYFNY